MTSNGNKKCSQREKSNTTPFTKLPFYCVDDSESHEGAESGRLLQEGGPEVRSEMESKIHRWLIEPQKLKEPAHFHALAP